jgi:hypothetical protein
MVEFFSYGRLLNLVVATQAYLAKEKRMMPARSTAYNNTHTRCYTCACGKASPFIATIFLPHPAFDAFEAKSE